MKAIVIPQYGDPDVLQLRDIPDPTGGPDDLVVRVGDREVTATEPFGVWEQEYLSIPLDRPADGKHDRRTE